MTLADAVCLQARELIASRLGLDFPQTRQPDLERALTRALRTSSFAEPQRYLAWLATLPGESPEWRALARHLTVGETYFFRDRASFEALEQQVLPSLIEARRTEGTLRLRLWSAACATGEEPYSLAIVLHRLLPDVAQWALTILATDINPQALEVARRGCYREWSLRETPAWIREQYFHRRGAESFELDPRIRGMVAFTPLNLAAEGYPEAVSNTSAMDLILCRNVLMYFTREAQHATVTRLQQALMSGGWLVVSPAEASADLFHPLVPVNFPGAIFYRKEPLARADWGGYVANTLRQQIPSPVSTLPPPLQRARVLADQGKLQEARHLCEGALTRNRLDPEVYLLLAAVCQEQGDIQAALEALRRAIYLAPDFAPAHVLLGSLLVRGGEHTRGRRCLETAVRLLSLAPRAELLPGCDGLTAGRLLETARAYLDSAVSH